MGRGKGRGSIETYKRDGKNNYRLLWMDAQGRRRKRNVGSNRAHAEKLLNQIIAERDLQEAGVHGSVGMDRKLEELAREYLPWLEENRSRSHSKRTEGALGAILSKLTAQRVNHLAVSQVRQYQSRRLRDGVSSRTVNVETQALCAMLNWCVDSGLVAENPLAALKHLTMDATKVRRKRRPLDKGEVRALLDVARARDMELNRPVPYSLLWESLLATGARPGELTRSAWGDLDVEAGTLTLRATKNKHPRTVPLLDPSLAGRLQDHRAKRSADLRRMVRNDELIFLSPRGSAIQINNTRREFQKVLADAGIETPDPLGQTVDLYSLRHTFGSWMAARGVPLADLSKMMGHRDPKVTMNYYVTPDVEAQKQRLDALGIRDEMRHLFGT